MVQEIEGSVEQKTQRKRHNRNRNREALSMGTGDIDTLNRKKSKKSRKHKALIGTLPNFSMMNSEEELVKGNPTMVAQHHYSPRGTDISPGP